jgi:Na+/melibiose symporter-like transporter
MKSIKVIIAKIILIILTLGFVGLEICGLIYAFKDTIIGICVVISFLGVLWSIFALWEYYEQKKIERENQNRNNIKEANQIVKNMKKYV